MYITKNFKAQEILPKNWWVKYGKTGLRVMDNRIVSANQKVRERQGKSRFVNTWVDGGGRNESGLRTPEMVHYNILSMHSWGKAIDSISHIIPHEELWDDVIKNPQVYWDMGITCIESINIASTWLHIDCRGYDYIGNTISELQIIEKHDGEWTNMNVDKWIVNFNNN